MLIAKTVAVVSAATISGWMGFSWLTGVTETDIYAYHSVEFSTGDMLLHPGSVVAVSPRGQITRICSLKAVTNEPGDLFTYVYYNLLRKDFPDFVEAVKMVKNTWQGDSVTIEATTGETITLTAAPRNGKKFTGREASITDLREADEFLETDCEAKMAWHLSEGYLACTVQRSLNAAIRNPEGELKMKTVAVAFAERSNFVIQSKFDEAGVPYNKAAQAANGQRCDGSTLPWIVKLRRNLQIIDRMRVNVSET